MSRFILFNYTNSYSPQSENNRFIKYQLNKVQQNLFLLNLQKKWLPIV